MPGDGCTYVQLGLLAIPPSRAKGRVPGFTHFVQLNAHPNKRTSKHEKTPMAQDIWINLPVKDLAKSITFFTKIGFAHNPGPGNSDKSASFTIGDKKVVLMLFVQDVFAGFANHPLSDTGKGSEVLFSLGADSRDQVNDIASRATSAGGTVFAEPRESNGFMYGCGFCDPDGHRWNVLFMDASKMPQ